MNANNLTEIVKKENKYFFRFENPVSKTFQFALPVYTNAKSMIDNIGISRNIKAIATATKQTVEETMIEVPKELAQTIYDIAKNNEIISTVERFESVNGWVVRIK